MADGWRVGVRPRGRAHRQRARVRGRSIIGPCFFAEPASTGARPAAPAGMAPSDGTAWRLIGSPDLEHVPFVVSEGLDDIARRRRGARRRPGRRAARQRRDPSATWACRAPAGPLSQRCRATDRGAGLSVEHETVLGVPGIGPDGRPFISGGSGPAARPHDPRTRRGDARPHRRRPPHARGSRSHAWPRLPCCWAARRSGSSSTWSWAAASPTALAVSPDPTLRPGRRHAHDRGRARASSARRCSRSLGSSRSASGASWRPRRTSGRAAVGPPRNAIAGRGNGTRTAAADVPRPAGEQALVLSDPWQEM